MIAFALAVVLHFAPSAQAAGDPCSGNGGPHRVWTCYAWDSEGDRYFATSHQSAAQARADVLASCREQSKAPASCVPGTADGAHPTGVFKVEGIEASRSGTNQAGAREDALLKAAQKCRGKGRAVQQGGWSYAEGQKDFGSCVEGPDGQPLCTPDIFFYTFAYAQFRCAK